MKTIQLNKDLYEKDRQEFNLLAKKVYFVLKDLNQEYPNFESWFNSKVIPDIKWGDRNTVLKIDNDKIAGISILKKTNLEKKICTFRVVDEYQRSGVGRDLMIDSFHYLETESPIITVSESRKHEFSKLLERFRFKLHSKEKSYYQKSLFEYSFNGPIESQEKKDKLTPGSYWMNSKIINSNNFDCDVFIRHVNINNYDRTEIKDKIKSYLESNNFKINWHLDKGLNTNILCTNGNILTSSKKTLSSHDLDLIIVFRNDIIYPNSYTLLEGKDKSETKNLELNKLNFKDWQMNPPKFK
jgi:hypothetical protein